MKTPKQPRQRKEPISDTSETETEPDMQMTKEQVDQSRQWKIGTVKEAAKPKAGKSSNEMVKRVIVGIMVFSWYTVPIVTHPLASPIFLIPALYFLSSEAHHIKMKDFERASWVDEVYRCLLYLVLSFMIMPYFSCF